MLYDTYEFSIYRLVTSVFPCTVVGHTFSLLVHLLNLRDKIINNRTSTDFEVKLSVLCSTLPCASSFLVSE